MAPPKQIHEWPVAFSAVEADDIIPWSQNSATGKMVLATLLTYLSSIYQETSGLTSVIEAAVLAYLIEGPGITLAVTGTDKLIVEIDLGFLDARIAATTATLAAETIDDRIAALLQPGSGISLNYDDTANTLTISAAASGGGGFNPPSPLVGSYSSPGQYTGGAVTGTLAFVADQIDCYYVYLSEPLTYDQFQFDVSTAAVAGNSIRFGFYNAASNLPTTLIYDSGNIAVTTTGVKTVVPPSPVTLPAGVSFFAFHSRGAVTVRALNHGSYVTRLGYNGAAANFVGPAYLALSGSQTFGPLVNNPTVSLVGGSQRPLLIARRSA